MLKQLTFATLACLSVSAMAEDTIYIKDFDHVISETRIMDDDNWLIGNYEARLKGKSLIGSTNPQKTVDIRLRTFIDYYSEGVSQATEVTRAVAAESCLNMANQLRLSNNSSLALKLTLPSKSEVNSQTGAIEYLIDHIPGHASRHHMAFECELTSPPGPNTRFDNPTDVAEQVPTRPTRRAR